jgi:hypothetical protein
MARHLIDKPGEKWPIASLGEELIAWLTSSRATRIHPQLIGATFGLRARRTS